MNLYLTVHLINAGIIFLGCANVLFLAGGPRRRPMRFIAYEVHRHGYVLLALASFAVLVGSQTPPGTWLHFHEPQWQTFLLAQGISAIFVGRAIRTIFGPLLGGKSCMR